MIGGICVYCGSILNDISKDICNDCINKNTIVSE